MNLNHFYHYYKSKSGGVSNLLKATEDFDSSIDWNKLPSTDAPTVSGGITDPNGGSDAQRINFTDNRQARVQQRVSLSASTQYTFSVYARVNTGTQQFRLRNVTLGEAEAKTATTSWTRFEYTFTTTTGGNYDLSIQNTSNDAKTIEFWGAMLNVGASANDYVKVDPSISGSTPTPAYSGFGDTYGDVTAYYSLRKFTEAETLNAIRVRRSSDDTEQDIGFDANGDLDTTALTTFVNADVDIYTSDFTSGNEDMAEVNGTGADGQSIAGVDDAYKFTLSGGAVAHYTRTDSAFDRVNSYDVSFDYYIPSGQTIDGIRVRTGTTSDGEYDQTTLDAWTSVAIENWTPTSKSTCRFNALVGSSIDPIDADGDVFYLKNIVITQTTADGAVTTFYDPTGNGNDATNSTASEQPLIVSGGSVESLGGEVTPVRQGVTTTLDISGVESSVTGAFTIATRFYLSSQSDSDCIFGGRGLTSGAGLCASYLSGAWRFEVITTTGTRAIVSVSDTNTPINNWYNVVFTWDGTTDSNAVKVYLNTSSNIFTATANGTVINYDASYPMSIFNADRNSFDGGLATWTIFNSQITDIDGLFTAITP